MCVGSKQLGCLLEVSIKYADTGAGMSALHLSGSPKVLCCTKPGKRPTAAIRESNYSAHQYICYRKNINVRTVYSRNLVRSIVFSSVSVCLAP